MGMPVPDAVKRLIDARDMTVKTGTVPRRVGRRRSEGLSPVFEAASDRVPSPANRKVLLSGDYKEEQLRAEFLNPFFTALGWDMNNRQGLSETFKQVIHEESIKVTGASKAPDHTPGVRPPPDLLTG